MSEAIEACNEQLLDEQINAGLQISRLVEIRRWGSITLILFLGFSSILVNKTSIKPWDFDLVWWNPYVNAILLALSIAFIGASGGFLSGLMDIRSSKTDLAKYQESLLRTQLKPLVGGIAALIIYVFISYGIISGISIKNHGTILSAAFLSGFSERFFLRLLDIQNNEDRGKITDVPEVE